MLFQHGYALLIGVGQCVYEPWSLPVTVADAHALHATLTDPERSAYPPSLAHTRVLHDTGATRQSILEGLDWLTGCCAADPEATALVFYSGHGWRDETGAYWLIPNDVNPLAIQASALAGTVFADAIRRIAAQRLLVIMDCCHAAGMAAAKAGRPSAGLPPQLLPTAPPKGMVTALQQGSGRAVFSSSRGEERSWIRPDGTLSLYTHHLIEALEGAGSRAGDIVVWLSSLMYHLGKAVPASAAALGQVQTPFFETSSEDFPVALLAGGKGLNGQIVSAEPAPALSLEPHLRPAEVERMIERLEAERERLADLLLLRSIHGRAWVQPGTMSGIREAHQSIQRIKAALREQAVSVSDHPDDEG